MFFNSQNEYSSFFLPITSEYQRIAQQFAVQQPTVKKAEQVFLNTLAVLVVNNYLELLGIATSLANCDSWNPVLRTCSDVADLEILEIGKIECRPVKISESSCYVPMDVWDLRVGYVVVQVDNLCKKAALLGFVQQVDSEELAISHLETLEKLIDRLHDLKEASLSSPLTSLSQWLNNNFAAGWQAVEALLTSERLTLSWEFRGRRSSQETSPESLGEDKSVSRAKLIDLGIQLASRQVVLIVKVSQEELGIAVILQVHPTNRDRYLPEELELKVIESSEVFMQAQSRSRDNYIQLQFRGQPEEVFEVEITLEGSSFLETFKL